MTWVSTVNLIALAGATPVFVDVDRDTLMTTADRVALFIVLCAVAGLTWFASRYWAFAHRQ